MSTRTVLHLTRFLLTRRVLPAAQIAFAAPIAEARAASVEVAPGVEAAVDLVSFALVDPAYSFVNHASLQARLVLRGEQGNPLGGIVFRELPSVRCASLGLNFTFLTFPQPDTDDPEDIEARTCAFAGICRREQD